MTDERLHQLILRYYQGSYNAYDTPDHSARVVVMTTEEKAEKLGWISEQIAERGGRFVVGREQFTIRAGKLVVGMAT